MEIINKTNPSQIKKHPKLRYILPVPLSFSIYLDCLYIFEILIVQDFIIPKLNYKLISIDLLTPWLCLSFIFYTPLRSLVMLLIASLSLESHSAVPLGLYFTSYWMIGSIITLLKHSISWINVSSWVTYIASSLFLIILIKTLVVSILSSLNLASQYLFSPQLWIHFALSLSLGVWLTLRYGQTRFKGF